MLKKILYSNVRNTQLLNHNYHILRGIPSCIKVCTTFIVNCKQHLNYNKVHKKKKPHQKALWLQQFKKCGKPIFLIL